MKLNLGSTTINLISTILFCTRVAVAAPMTERDTVDGIPTCSPRIGYPCDPSVDLPCCMSASDYAFCDHDDIDKSGYIWQVVHCYTLETDYKQCAQSGSNAWCASK
jgi:hypothetical protein